MVEPPGLPGIFVTTRQTKGEMGFVAVWSLPPALWTGQERTICGPACEAESGARRGATTISGGLGALLPSGFAAITSYQ